MRIAVLTLQWLIRACFIVQLTLGALFWTGNAYALVQVHMLTGIVLVLGFWMQAVFAARSGAGWGAPATAFVWGLFVIGLGINQTSLLTGDLHWLIKVAHLLVGLGAVGQAETLGAEALRQTRQAPSLTGYTLA